MNLFPGSACAHPRHVEFFFRPFADIRKRKVKLLNKICATLSPLQNHAMCSARFAVHIFSVAAVVMTMLLPTVARAIPSASNPLFSISVPANLVVETDNMNTLIAGGPHGEEGLPFLIVYFCTLAPSKNGITPCDATWHALTADDVRKLTTENWRGTISTRDRGNSVTEWAACVEQPGGVVACLRRLRSQSGYVDLRYISNAPQYEVEQSMEAFAASIKWVEQR